jgi:SAM-dependent methyltransferase
MKSYADLFEERGSSYDRAMRKYPRARDEEFAQLLAPLDLAPGTRIGDVPAGGGYLRRYLPAGVIWEGHEPCASFTNHGARSDDPANHPLLPLPWADGALDCMVSLAGVHHIEDRPALWREVARVLKPGGRFVLSDVEEGSAPARFLDGFVGDNNSTGHEGLFLHRKTPEALEASGLRVLASRSNAYHWRFGSRDELAEFTRLLFDICKATPGEVADAIESELGIEISGDGEVGMNWALRTIVCERP